MDCYTALQTTLQPCRVRETPDEVCEGLGWHKTIGCIGRQKRLWRCFGDLEVASEWHRKTHEFAAQASICVFHHSGEC